MQSKQWLFAFALTLCGLPAMAHDQNHAAASDSHGSELGVPGKASDVTGTRTIVMRETSEGQMEFAPSVLEAKPGETLRIVLRNKGQIDHEFLLATPEEISEHAAMMRDFPDMQHEEPNAIRLQPGASGDIIWKFGSSARLEFACLIPGHYEAGMHGRVALGN
jgi:uncharacterized cupredoxin-like copper-binding protein